jgi:hypothetical protein
LIVGILAALSPVADGRGQEEADRGPGRGRCDGYPHLCGDGPGPRGHPGGRQLRDFRVYEVDLRQYFHRAITVSNVVYDQSTGSVSYVITITAPAGIGGADKTLDQAGIWSDGK